MVLGPSTSSGIGCRTTGIATTRVILKLQPMVARRLIEEFLALSHPDSATVAGTFSYTGR